MRLNVLNTIIFIIKSNFTWLWKKNISLKFIIKSRARIIQNKLRVDKKKCYYFRFRQRSILIFKKEYFY